MNGKYPVIAAVMMLATGCSQFSQTNHAAKNHVNPFVGTTVLTIAPTSAMFLPGALGTA